MKKNIFTLGIASVLALSLLAGCSGQKAGTPDAGDAARKPVVNFEGVVTAAEDGTLTLDSGKTVVITDRTEFAPDPDSDGTVSRDIAVGNYIQGYTADGAGSLNLTLSRVTAAPQTTEREAVSRVRGTAVTLTEDASIPGYLMLGAQWERSGTTVHLSSEGLDKKAFITVLKELI